MVSVQSTRRIDGQAEVSRCVWCADKQGLCGYAARLPAELRLQNSGVLIEKLGNLRLIESTNFRALHGTVFE